MNNKGWIILMGVALSLLPSAVMAASPPEVVYVVQADDRLERLAEKFYGDTTWSPVIVAATNAAAANSPGVTPIDDPTMLAAGQKLIVPPPEVAAEQMAMLAAPAGPSPEQSALLASLPSLGQPPELYNQVWLNSDPLKLADLHGKVVIVEFWTFG
jgi:hypothetical protein